MGFARLLARRSWIADGARVVAPQAGHLEPAGPMVARRVEGHGLARRGIPEPRSGPVGGSGSRVPPPGAFVPDLGEASRRFPEAVREWATAKAFRQDAVT